MKRIISLSLACIMLISAACLLNSCHPAANSELNNALETEKSPSQDELKAMEDEGYNYWRVAQFNDGFEIFQQLYELGYYSDDEFEGKELQYRIYCLQCQLCWYAVGFLRGMLNDPNSLVLYGFRFKANDSSSITMILDFGATNAFGGMVRDKYEKRFNFTDEDKKLVYSYAKHFHPSETFLLQDMTEYFSTISTFAAYGQQACDAVVNKTCNYKIF